MNAKHWAKKSASWDAAARPGPRWRSSYTENSDISVSYNNAEANWTASELQALTMDPEDVVVRPEVA